MKHFEDALDSANDIDWAGVPFDTNESTSWLRPRLAGPFGSPVRDGDRRELWVLTVDCFAKTGKSAAGAALAGLYRHTELADLVRAQYHGKTVSVRDWNATDDPVVFYLRFGDIQLADLTGSDIGEGAKLMHLQASFEGMLIDA